jgi:hypothetical protein
LEQVQVETPLTSALTPLMLYKIIQRIFSSLLLANPLRRIVGAKVPSFQRFGRYSVTQDRGRLYDYGFCRGRTYCEQQRVIHGEVWTCQNQRYWTWSVQVSRSAFGEGEYFGERALITGETQRSKKSSREGIGSSGRSYYALISRQSLGIDTSL